MVSNQIILGALLVVNIVLYAPLIFAVFRRRARKVSASNLADAFNGLELALKEAVPGLPAGFTWEKEVDLLLMCLLARGHVLLEGVPGVSKTLVANAFSKCLGLQFKRVQFTPDILPLDIIGGFIFNLKNREFEFRKGPVFTNILLA